MYPASCRGAGASPPPRSSPASRLRLAAVLLVGLAVGFAAGVLLPREPHVRAADGAAATGPLVLAGTTQPAPGHSAAIAPQDLQPVREVLAQPGDRVRKGQPLIRQDDDQARLTVEMKKDDVQELRDELGRLKRRPRREEIGAARAELEKAQVGTQDAKKRLDRLNELYQKGAIPERTYQAALADYKQAQQEEQAARNRLAVVEKEPVSDRIAAQESRIRSAEKALALAQADLDDLTITARIDGVVSRLDVTPGTVVRPGTATWGEVLDLAVLDVRCAAAPEQARRLRPGQAAEVREGGQVVAQGKVVTVGAAADPNTGKIPILVRAQNPGERLPSHVAVEVAFPDGGR